MADIINIQAAKTHLSRLVEDAVSGKDVVIGKAGKPLVRLVPYQTHRAPRAGGQFAGLIKESADCWAPVEDPFAGALDEPFPRLAPSLRVAEEKPGS